VNKSQAGELGEALRVIEIDPTRTGALRNWLVAVLYRVGIVGLKLESFEPSHG
jgi:hypothetical protein